MSIIQTYDGFSVTEDDEQLKTLAEPGSQKRKRNSLQNEHNPKEYVYVILRAYLPTLKHTHAFRNRAIASLLAQTALSKMNIVVVLNGVCKGDTEQEKWDEHVSGALQDLLTSKVDHCVVCYDTPLGGGGSFNEALKYCISPRATHIAIMDADDVCSPLRIEKQLDYLKRNKEVDACGTYFVDMRDDNKGRSFPVSNIDLACSFYDGIKTLEKHDDIVKAIAASGKEMMEGFLLWPSLLMKKELLIEMTHPLYIGPHVYNENQQFPDWDWIKRAFKTGVRFANVPDTSMYTYFRTLSVSDGEKCGYNETKGFEMK